MNNQDVRETKITEIYCPNCGAPAKFDILKQQYHCASCGGSVGIGEACRQKEGFRKIRRKKLQDDVSGFDLVHTSCSGCGAQIVFEKSEAVADCAFCGRSLVRSEYLDTQGLPECVIPFAITEEEAKERLRDWCRKNRRRPEAKHLLPRIDELKGFYLPYELVRGPVHMSVSRMDSDSLYFCEGFIENEFVNRSEQLDNLLLDGMEPFDLDSLTEFDFAYVAGHRVKIADISDKMLETRTAEETADAYRGAVQKIMETRAVEVRADVGSALRLPVLLPVYYISLEGKSTMAAVNGQTGKVSVRSEKEGHYYFLPWWLKAILITAAFGGILYAALALLFGMAAGDSLFITGAATLTFFIVMLCLYSDTTKNRFSVEAGYEIFTSEGPGFHRERGRLVPNDKKAERKTAEPVFFMTLKDVYRPVVLKFTTPGRILKMIIGAVVVLFLPVILALFINGFDTGSLELAGSAVWFCIMVPVVPVYFVKYGITELHDRPMIYTISEKGKKKRYRGKLPDSDERHPVKTVLIVLFKPPGSFAVWAGIAMFFFMVYLTAFGF